MLAVDEDENRVRLQQDRLRDSEKRNAAILSEIEEQRKELDELRKENHRLQRDTSSQQE